jgi:AbrB family looped-hinge helix DNA binding protein
MTDGINNGMTNTISMDASGRMVLPKAIRERMNLRAGARLRADVVAGRLELTPIPGEVRPKLKVKSGITVLARTGAAPDAAAAIAAERESQAAQGKVR